MSASSKIFFLAIVLLLLLLFLTFMMPSWDPAGGLVRKTGVHDAESGAAVPYSRDGVILRTD